MDRLLAVLLLLIPLAKPALADKASQAELDRLATALRESCKALTATPNDGARIGAQIGAVVSHANGVTTVQVPSLSFATVSVEDLHDHPEAASLLSGSRHRFAFGPAI